MNSKEISSVVGVCRECGKFEYYNLMTWFSGKQSCRVCTYERWEKTSDWVRTEENLVYPDYMEA